MTTTEKPAKGPDKDMLEEFATEHQELRDERGETGRRFKDFWARLKEAGLNRKVFEAFVELKDVPADSYLLKQSLLNSYLQAGGRNDLVLTNEQLLLFSQEDAKPSLKVVPDPSDDYAAAADAIDGINPADGEQGSLNNEADANKIRLEIMRQLVEKNGKKRSAISATAKIQVVNEDEVRSQWDHLVETGTLVKDGQGGWKVAEEAA